MYTEEEASALRREFWTRLGLYMQPVPGASGQKMNWINYKTGVKSIRFRMDAQRKEAFVAIEIRASEPHRKTIYQHFLSHRIEFPPSFEWIEDCWDEHGNELSRIYTERVGLSVLNRNHWPELIQFFKENLILLDAFWFEKKDIFEMISP